MMKNVHDDVGIIRDHPLADREPVHRLRLDAVVLFQPVAQFAHDGLEMRFRGAGTNHEEICEAGNAAEIDGQDILGFFSGDEVRAEAGE